MTEILKDARERQYAVPLFSTPTLNTAVGVLRAAETLNAPVIFGFYDLWIEMPEAHAVCAGMRALANASPVPVSLMLDHGKNFEQCIKAMRFGFTDVMFDGSALPFTENARITKMICQAAHAIGVGVEAELGHVGKGDDYNDADVRAHYTQPGMLEDFVSETGVDFLAVAIGTAHGEYKSTPKLDLELLAELNTISTVPLVLHGGSGLSEEQFLGSIKHGIAKVNVATAIFKEYVKRVSGAKDADIIALEELERQTFADVCAYFLQLFGAERKA
jgi:fructose-bisphosphate aldolase class II